MGLEELTGSQAFDMIQKMGVKLDIYKVDGLYNCRVITSDKKILCVTRGISKEDAVCLALEKLDNYRNI